MPEDTFYYMNKLNDGLQCMYCVPFDLNRMLIPEKG